MEIDGVEIGPGLNLRNSNLNINEKDLSDLDLNSSNISFQTLKNVNFTRSDLSGVNFSGTILEGVNLKDANLSGANLEGVNMTTVDLRGVKYGNIAEGPTLCDEDKIISGYIVGPKVDLSGADLSDVNLTGMFNCTKNAISIMNDKGLKSVVNISSIDGQVSKNS